MRRFTPCMWFKDQAEQAAQHYVSVFRLSRITSISRQGGGRRLPPGCAHTVAFELDGESFLAHNIGIEPRRLPALSLVVQCDTQDEIDHYWSQLSPGGVTHRGGWISDRFGVSWQVVPSVLAPMLADPDPQRAARMSEALGQMRKLDIGKLQRAWQELRAASSDISPRAPPARVAEGPLFA